MEPSGSRQSPAAPWPPGAGAPRGPPPSCCPGAGRPFSAPTRPPAPSRHASGTRLRGGPVALRSIFVLALWHPRTPLSSLWRSGPERTRTDLALWDPRPERTRTDLALRRSGPERTRTYLALRHPGPERTWPCGAQGQNPRRSEGGEGRLARFRAAASVER